MLKSLLIVALTFSSLASAAPWGAKELRIALNSALDSLSASVSANVSGFKIERTVQGNTARAEITYVQGGVKKVIRKFCHVHDDDGTIDCH